MQSPITIPHPFVVPLPIPPTFSKPFLSAPSQLFELPTTYQNIAQKPLSELFSGEAFKALFDDLHQEFVTEISSRTKMVLEIKEMNTALEEQLVALRLEMKEISDHFAVMNNLIAEGGNEESKALHNIEESKQEISELDHILTTVSGKHRHFKYFLTLDQPEFPNRLSRGRNFRFDISVTDGAGNVVPNSNKIVLRLMAFSSEKVPMYLDTNRSGGKLLKGLLERHVFEGKTYFDKIRFDEVTSHFPNGWVYLVIAPKHLPISFKSAKKANPDAGYRYINPKLIKPLIIQRIQVKAKTSAL